MADIILIPGLWLNASFWDGVVPVGHSVGAGIVYAAVDAPAPTARRRPSSETSR